MSTLSQRKPGVGLPVVVLHGFLGDETAWDEVIRPLPNPVWAARLPGHGADGASPRASTYRDAVADLADALSLDVPGVLAGYSMGGRLALSLVKEFGDRLSGLLLIGTNPGILATDERRDRERWDEAWARRFEAEPLAGVLADWEALPIFASQVALPEPVREAQRRIRASRAPAGAAWALRTLGLGAMPPAWALLGAVPTILLAGELDERHARLADTAASQAPQTTSRVIPDAGHNLLLEAPGHVSRALLELASPLHRHESIPLPPPRTCP